MTAKGDTPLSEIVPGEHEKEIAAIRQLPGHLQTSYVGVYDTDRGDGFGKFVGLVCRKCGNQHGTGHAKDCVIGKYYE